MVHNEKHGNPLDTELKKKYGKQIANDEIINNVNVQE